jgi:hypothetical protein
MKLIQDRFMAGDFRAAELLCRDAVAAYPVVRTSAGHLSLHRPFRSTLSGLRTRRSGRLLTLPDASRFRWDMKFTEEPKLH